jgi:hypothetical protein
MRRNWKNLAEIKVLTAMVRNMPVVTPLGRRDKWKKIRYLPLPCSNYREFSSEIGNG